MYAGFREWEATGDQDILLAGEGHFGLCVQIKFPTVWGNGRLIQK